MSQDKRIINLINQRGEMFNTKLIQIGLHSSVRKETEKGYEISFTNSALKQQLHVLFEYETTKILCTYESQKGVPPAEKIDPLMQYRGAIFDPTGISDTIAAIQMFLKFGRTGFSQGYYDIKTPILYHQMNLLYHTMIEKLEVASLLKYVKGYYYDFDNKQMLIDFVKDGIIVTLNFYAENRIGLIYYENNETKYLNSLEYDEVVNNLKELLHID